MIELKFSKAKLQKILKAMRKFHVFKQRIKQKQINCPLKIQDTKRTNNFSKQEKGYEQSYF